MNAHAQWIAYCGLTRKEIIRWLRIWQQTVIPSALTAALYFLIFGSFIGHRIGLVEGISYITFIAPGLVMMSVITNSYANVTSSFFGARIVSRNFEEILVSPMPAWLIIAGFCSGGITRGVLTGIITYIVASCFSGWHLVHPLLTIVALLLCSTLFALAGMLNGLYARKFDDTAVFVTFVLTPLIYLGGVFYSVDELGGIWRTLSHFNPIYYLISFFRESMLGIDTGNAWLLVGIILIFTIALFVLVLSMIVKGIRVRN